MLNSPRLGKIDLQLVRVLHTVITEGSVSRAALKLGSTQPAISAQLKRLRALTGDALLVRSGTGLAPTTTALSLVEPAATILREAQLIFGERRASRAFDPATSQAAFTIAASDYLDPLFLPELVARLQAGAPNARIELHALSPDYDYRSGLARGEVDLVIGNWLEPPANCIWRGCSPTRSSVWSAKTTRRHAIRAAGYRRATSPPNMWHRPTSHRGARCHRRAPGSPRPRAPGRRAQPALRPHPLMLAQTHLVLTTGRLFCSRFVEALPVKILRCPIEFPPLAYYQLWHDVSHASAAGRWLREQVRDVALTLASHQPPARRRSA